MPYKILLDENVCAELAGVLRRTDYEVEHVASMEKRLEDDTAVWKWAKDSNSLLITRDHGFTNPIRFPSQDVPGIVFLRKGNLTAEQEIGLVVSFLRNVDEKQYAGKLAILSPHEIRIRP